MYKGVKSKIEKRIKVPVLTDILTVFFILNAFVAYFFKAYLLLPSYRTKGDYEAKSLLQQLCPVPNDTEIIRLSASNRYDLSIILPVFNAEEFIKQTLESVLLQKTQFSYQIICVNDGSTDNSGEILSQYSSEEHIKVIYQENSGISAARNRGLEAAESEFVMFLDADDLLLPGAIEGLVKQQRLSDSDIVVGGFLTFEKLEDLRFLRTGEFLWEVLDQENAWFKVTDGFPWGKIYRKQLWKDVRFPVGYQFEDTIIKGLIFRLAAKISYTSTQVLGYRQHGTSITKKLQTQPNSVVFVFWAVEFVLKKNKTLQLKEDSTLHAFLQSHLTKIILMRAKYLDTSTLALLFNCSRVLIQDYPCQPGKVSAQAKAFIALGQGNFRAWYFWSSLATLEV